MQKDLLTDLLLNQIDYAAEMIRDFKEHPRKIYIFCAGIGGIQSKKALLKNNIPVYRFVDNNLKKIGTKIDGVPVISFHELCADKSFKSIIIGSAIFHQEIVDQCLTNGILDSEICYADFMNYDAYEATKEYIFNHTDDIISIYSKCGDEYSKQLFIDSVLYQLHRNRKKYRPILSPLSEQYYDPHLIHLADDCVYFDCGAKDGDTALAFHKITNGNYRQIFSFEPDEGNYTMLKRNTCSYEKIRTLNFGVGETHALLPFASNQGAYSQFTSDTSFNEHNQNFARIVPLDDYYSEMPSLIKMDIEGYELNALKGSQKILAELHPQLAICLYHKPCDVIEIPAYILFQNPNYQIYFRIYRDFGHDLTCYCV